jgi:hypothetical protein
MIFEELFELFKTDALFLDPPVITRNRLSIKGDRVSIRDVRDNTIMSYGSRSVSDYFTNHDFIKLIFSVRR